jgi:hypothetical protein
VQLSCILGAAAAGLLLGLASSSLAQSVPPPALRYLRAAGAAACPDEETFRADVAGRLGRDPFADRSDRVIAVTLTRRGATLEGVIELHEPSGMATRRFRSLVGDCSELAAAVELALAIAVDAVEAPTPSRPAGAPPRPPPPIDAVTRPPAPRPAPAPSLACEASVGVLGSVGSVPVASLGTTLQVAVGRGPLWLALEGRADFPAVRPLRTGAVEGSLLAVSLAPGVRGRSLAGYTLLTAGALRAAGRGLDDARHVEAAFVAAGARAAYHRAIGRLGLTLHLDLLVPLTETTLQVSGADVWTTPPVTASIGLKVGVRAP